MAKEKLDPRRPKGDTGIADIYTEDKGQPPMGQDMGSIPKKPPKKMAKGGSASSRADGCAIKGKTKGRMV